MNWRNTDTAEQGGRPAPLNPAFYAEDPSGSSGEVLRLLLAPTIVAGLFVGGVYWVKLQLAGTPSKPDESSTVQVRLLAPSSSEPIPMAETQRKPVAIAARSSSTAEPTDPPGKDIVAPQVSPAAAPIGVVPPVNRATTGPPADLPPKVAAIKYQQTLLQHVARYQRYPKAVRYRHAYGAVGTMFSMRRDGTVLAVRITSSSGQAVFDKEAVDTILRAQPLPSIPPDLPDTITVEATLVFEPS